LDGIYVYGLPSARAKSLCHGRKLFVLVLESTEKIERVL
jgi:hypothetical protein